MSNGRPDIDRALGGDVDWQTEGDDKYYVICRKTFPDVGDARYRAEIIYWLRERANSFVTVFRPRIEALLREAIV